MPVHGGGFALSNSLRGSYGNNTDNWARLTQGLDLRGRRDCAAIVWDRTSLGTFDPNVSLGAQDLLIGETSPDGSDWGRRLNALTGFGRALLRRASRVRLTVVLTFAPRACAPIARRTTVTVRRHSLAS